MLIIIEFTFTSRMLSRMEVISSSFFNVCACGSKKVIQCQVPCSLFSLAAIDWNNYIHIRALLLVVFLYQICPSRCVLCLKVSGHHTTGRGPTGGL